jgi:hypothetical protein
MWQCSFCSFSSSWSFNVARHEERKHQNENAPIVNVTEPKQIQLSREQPPVQSQMPFQQPLQFVENQHLGNARAGEKGEVYSDDDTLSEYSSHGKQHDFFDSDSDSETYTEPGEVLENAIEEIDEQFDNIIELRGKFRGSLGEMKEADMEKKKRILKKVAALIVKIFDESEGINPDEDSESDEEEDANESKEEETEEDEDVDEEEGVNLNDDNPFSFIEEIKLSIDERDNEILDNEIQKVIKKHMDEKQDEIDDDSDESDNECGVTEKVFKQDEKKLRECINGIECEGCEYFEHCSNDKVDTIYRWCKHILNNEEQYDQKNLQKVKVKWMPIRFHVRAMADPEQPLHDKRKILQKAAVGDGIMSGLATLALPMMKTFFRMMRDRG